MNIDVRQLWTKFRPSSSAKPYYGVAHDQPSETELLSYNDQLLPSSSPLPARDSQSEGSGSRNNDSGRNELEESEAQGSHQSKPDWIGGVYLCAKGTAILLLLNLTLTATAAGLASKYTQRGGSFIVAVIYDGSCNTTSRWNTALHLIVNIFSTCILAASNYCMQTLVAPSRDELDISHAKRQWLDIGSASVKNLFVISFDRLGLWLVLLITATPFHLLYVLLANACIMNCAHLLGITPSPSSHFHLLPIGPSLVHTILTQTTYGI